MQRLVREEETAADAVRRVFALRHELLSVFSTRDVVENENEDVMMEDGQGVVVPDPAAVVNIALRWDTNFIQDRIITACRLANELQRAGAGAGAGVGAGENAADHEGNSSQLSRQHATAKGVLSRCLEMLYYLEQTVCTLRMTAKTLGVLPSNAALESSSSATNASSSSSTAENDTTREGEEDDSLAPGVFRFAPMDDSVKKTAGQQLILYMLNVVFSRGYCRCGSDCYERLLLPAAATAAATASSSATLVDTLPSFLYDTRAWRRVCSLRDLIYEATRKEIKFDQWLNLTQNKSNAQTVIDYMTHCSDTQFPSLVKNRHVFSFKNGIYLTASNAVLDPEFVHADTKTRRETLRDSFIPYGSIAYAELPSHIAACKFFNETFPADTMAIEGDWYHTVATPHLQSIMDYQRFDEDVCRWMYIMIGRLLYEQGEFDGWQVVPFLKGQASSGKSTIVYMCRNMFEPNDVGMLSNNIERKFGISSFFDKYLFVAPEIKADLQLEQAEFQSMVSGESVQVAFKFRDARTVDWKVPGIMAGNEVPGWIDNSGSISRRIVVFEFMRKVVDGDMELKYKLQRELPAIILKSNRAYHEAVRACGSDNLWNHLPEYFRRTKDELTESTNPIVHFMNSGKLHYDPDAYMPMDTLKRAFQLHCEENNFRKIRLTKDKFEPVMYEFSLTPEKNKEGITREYPRHQQHQQRRNVECHKEWCIGADLASSNASHHHHHQHENFGNGADNVFEQGGTFLFS